MTMSIAMISQVITRVSAVFDRLTNFSDWNSVNAESACNSAAALRNY